jgi:Flp pilus assembly protein CpaB
MMEPWQIILVIVVVVVVVGVVIALVQAARARRPPIPADWYPDEHDPTLQRYHDGSGWTEQTRRNTEDDY